MGSQDVNQLWLKIHFSKKTLPTTQPFSVLVYTFVLFCLFKKSYSPPPTNVLEFVCVIPGNRENPNPQHAPHLAKQTARALLDMPSDWMTSHL